MSRFHLLGAPTGARYLHAASKMASIGGKPLILNASAVEKVNRGWQHGDDAKIVFHGETSRKMAASL